MTSTARKKNTTMEGKDMKRAVIILILMLMPLLASAQDWSQADSVVYRQASAVDSTLVGKSIFNLLGSASEGTVRIHQSQAIADAMKHHIATNGTRTLTGYRVRIFFDNSKTARNASESVMRNFMAAHPGVPAYRSYQNPFFRVVAGDFRTKSEAVEFLQRIKPSYPSALVVKESIGFPAVDKEHNYIIDTVTVFRPAVNL